MTTEKILVVTLVGPDRPGLVDVIAETVLSHGGNWLESRMCRLGGQFAGILNISVPGAGAGALADALLATQSRGLEIVIKESQEPVASGPAHPAQLRVVGQDRPGIVRQISRSLAGHGVNVIEFQSSCESAPMSGESLFTADAKLELPEGLDADGLRSALERIAADLMVDVTLE